MEKKRRRGKKNARQWLEEQMVIKFRSKSLDAVNYRGRDT